MSTKKPFANLLYRPKHMEFFAVAILLGYFLLGSAGVKARSLSSGDCTSATPLSCGASETGEATLLDPDTFDPNCGLDNFPLSGKWFAFEGTGDVLTLATCGTQFNSSIAIFDGSCFDLTCLAQSSSGSDDCAPEVFETPSISIQTSPGVAYFICLFGSGLGETGAFTISASCEEPSPEPVNNNCESALTLEVNGPLIETSNIDATSSSQEFANCPSSGNGDAQNDVWFSFQAPESGRIVLETFAGELQNTRMQILDGCDGNIIVCDEDGGSGLMSRIEIPCEAYTPEQELLIQVDGFGAMGTFSISVAIESCQQITGCTDPEACNFNPNAAIDDESCLVPEPDCTTCEAEVLVIVDSDGDGVCDAEDGCPNDPNKTDPGICGCGEVDVDQNSNGICDLDEVPENDIPCSALVLECSELAMGNSFAASMQETCADEESRAGVWYEIDIVEPSVVSLQTCFETTDFDTGISVFTGTCENLSCYTELGGTGLIASDLQCESLTGFYGTAGEFIAGPGLYFIMVHGTAPNETGNYTLSVSCEPVSEITINGIVTWNSACGERAGEIELYEAGTASLATSENIVVSNSGTFSANPELIGTFDIFLKISGFLAVSELGVALNGSPIEIGFDTPIPGDLTGSNTIGLPDFSAFSTAYDSESGSTEYNILADFNCDGLINLQDFSVFSSNYGLSGVDPD